MDKKEIGLLIQRRRKELGLGREDLAVALGVDLSYITKIENGKANFTIDKLLKIAKKLEVSEYKLLSKSLLMPVEDTIKEPAIIEIFPDQTTKIEYDQFRTQDDFVPIRILESELSLGPGNEVYSAETEGYALIYKDAITLKQWTQTREAERYLCFKVKGDSMKPTIHDKSLIVIDTEDTRAVKNKVFVFWFEDTGEVAVKRLVKKFDEHLLIGADNPNEPGYPKLLKYKGVEQNPIRAKVVWTWNILK